MVRVRAMSVNRNTSTGRRAGTDQRRGSWAQAVQTLGMGCCRHSTAEGVAACTLPEVDLAQPAAAPSQERRRRQRKGCYSFAGVAARTLGDLGHDRAIPTAVRDCAVGTLRDHSVDTHRRFEDADTSSHHASRDSYRRSPRIHRTQTNPAYDHCKHYCMHLRCPRYPQIAQNVRS